MANRITESTNTFDWPCVIILLVFSADLALPLLLLCCCVGLILLDDEIDANGSLNGEGATFPCDVRRVVVGV